MRLKAFVNELARKSHIVYDFFLIKYIFFLFKSVFNLFQQIFLNKKDFLKSIF